MEIKTESEWFNADVAICEAVATILEELADKGSGYPASFESTSDWQGQLGKAIDGLKAYAEKGVRSWSDEAQETKAALRWVADNLEALWD